MGQAAVSGVRPGYTITKVDGKPTPTAAIFKTEVEAARNAGKEGVDISFAIEGVLVAY